MTTTTRRVLAIALVLLAVPACGGDDDDVPADPDAGGDVPGDPDAGLAPGPAEPFPERYCPGSDGCTGEGDDPLRVGAARAIITPELTETEWEDLDEDHLYTRDEPFTDENGNELFDAVWIAGFDNGRPATGVHDDLSVRAIVLERGDVRVGIAVIDCIGWFSDEMDATRAMLPEALELDHVIIASTHVHQGVDTLGLWGRVQLETGLRADYQALVREATVAALTDAVGGLTPVTMTVAQIKTIDETGSARPYVSDSRDPAIFDPRLTLIRFADAADPEVTVATLVNWGSHPEYAGDENNLLSADYVYWLREVIANGAQPTLAGPAMAGIGGEVVFMNGAFGGQVGPNDAEPIDASGLPHPQADMERAEAAGTNVGRLALEAITSAELAEDVPSPALSFRTGVIYVLVENVFYHVAAITGVFDRQLLGYDAQRSIGDDNLPYLASRVTYLQLGNVGIATAPGELHPELFIGGFDGSESWGFDLVSEGNENPPDLTRAPERPYLRDLVMLNDGVKYPLLFGAAEDFIGYIVPAYNYELGETPYIEEAPGDHYEETNSVGPLVEEHVVGSMRAIIEWRPPAN
jgi:hypothetical protein